MPAARRWIVGLVLAAVVLAIFVWRTARAPHAVRVTDVPRELAISLRADGAPLALERTREGLRAMVVGRPAIEAFVAGPCGEEPLPLREIPTGDTQLFVPAARPALVRVLVDDREAVGHSLAIGAQTLSPQGLGVLSTVAGACAGARRITIDGAEVATLPDDGSDLLVDVLGTHCYALRGDDREIVVLTQLDATEPTRELERLRPAHAHTLAHVDFPFTAVPARVDLDAIGRTHDAHGHVQLRSLVAIACDAP